MVAGLGLKVVLFVCGVDAVGSYSYQASRFQSFSDVGGMTTSTSASNIRYSANVKDKRVQGWKLALIQNRRERGLRSKRGLWRQKCGRMMGKKLLGSNFCIRQGKFVMFMF